MGLRYDQTVTLARAVVVGLEFLAGLADDDSDAFVNVVYTGPTMLVASVVAWVASEVWLAAAAWSRSAWG
ncbi:hypothetical protein EBN03_19005 [Nocardia stercoris]|uniref:Uncharacterized protein n=1 Tax=Nocardia stercoris TaxID=2483361 RepID=A0A3M2L220_9NOCA|nr:hypothetical protein EBN03_19005 [Nocardia stercoris]